MYTLKIKITKEILEKTKWCQMKPDRCAFATAVRDIFPEANVGSGRIFPFKNSTSFICITPDMDLFISRFDRKRVDEIPDMPEQEFDLPIPNHIIDCINIDEIKPLLENHHCLKLINS